MTNITIGHTLLTCHINFKLLYIGIKPNKTTLMRLKNERKKRERPMKKGKLIQLPRLLSYASFEDAANLPSIVAHFTCAV